MSAAHARVSVQAQEAAAGRLLSLLVDETGRAHALAQAGDGESLTTLLEARARMLDELDRTVQALGAQLQRAPSGQPPMTVSRHTLIDVATELERANAALLDAATAECVSIAAAIKRAETPDSVASAYAGSAEPGTVRLDLLR